MREEERQDNEKMTATMANLIPDDKDNKRRATIADPFLFIFLSFRARSCVHSSGSIFVLGDTAIRHVLAEHGALVPISRRAAGVRSASLTRHTRLHRHATPRDRRDARVRAFMPPAPIQPVSVGYSGALEGAGVSGYWRRCPGSGGGEE